MGGKGTHKEQSYPTIRNAVNVQAKALIQLLLKDGPTHRHTDTHTTGPQWSLLKASSSRTGELETRACAWTCPPRVVFDDLARRDSNLQHDAAPSTRYHVLQPATHQSMKPKEKIRGDDDPAGRDSNPQHDDDDHHDYDYDHDPFTTTTTSTTLILLPPSLPSLAFLIFLSPPG